MDVVYEGIRLTPAQIAASALQEGVHVIGLSILSGSHRELIPAVIDALHDAGVSAPVVVGGIIPEQDVAALRGGGRRRRVHAQGLRHHAHHARHRRAGRRRLRHLGARRGRLLGQRLSVSADGAALGARLRGRDLSAAPAALNLLESTAAADREQAAALLREVSPAALGGEAPAHVIGVTGPPGAGKSTLLSALLHGMARARAHGGRARRGSQLAPLGRLAARRPRAHRIRPSRPRRADPLDRRRRAARRARTGYPHGRRSARGGL